MVVSMELWKGRLKAALKAVLSDTQKAASRAHWRADT